MRDVSWSAATGRMGWFTERGSYVGGGRAVLWLRSVRGKMITSHVAAIGMRAHAGEALRTAGRRSRAQAMERRNTVSGFAGDTRPGPSHPTTNRPADRLLTGVQRGVAGADLRLGVGVPRKPAECGRRDLPRGPGFGVRLGCARRVVLRSRQRSDRDRRYLDGHRSGRSDVRRVSGADR